ncbi:CDPK-related protein kinase [Hordeum vulgare]|nr:CDPK-related protein kinase [Hordeum vulgare]
MWSSRRGSGSRPDGGSDSERERRVRSDAARKRGARRWTNRDMSPPASFLIRETEGYDRRHVAACELPRLGDGGVRQSACRRGLLLFRAPSPCEEAVVGGAGDVVAVKEEPEELGRRRVVGPEDFVADVEAVAAAIAERSLHEEAERRRHDEEIKDLQ